jgi:hypothetical protein
VAWRLPAYGTRSFDLLPGTVERFVLGRTGREALDPGLLGPLGGHRFDRVAFVYLDAFGCRFARRHDAHPLLRRAAADGVALELTSQFPSTTTAHTTTIHGGDPVGLHGLYEWFVYEPLLDRLIAPLIFSFAGDAEPGTLALDRDVLYPPSSFYPGLTAAGVRSTVVQPRQIASSPTTLAQTRGATAIVGYDGPRDGLERLAAALAEPGYAYLYLGQLDALMHDVGPDDPTVHEAIAAMLDVLHEGLQALPSGTLVLLTADHGMAAVSPDTTVYVNLLWPELERHLRRGADGKPLAPAGSCRDLFLHTLDGRAETVADGLAARLEGRMEVVLTSKLVADGVFGPVVSERLLSRLADVVVLPYAGESAYWLEPGRFVQRYRGQHGGLTPDEMEIPLLAFAV